ncbi:MAG: metal-dependent hydrolase [Pseudolysinimonas sp.]|uniref:metal-dependent hydrolase n=1 Tax=Pseudolysinimonas sp. TaxID=2680009 RepID=UPI003C76B73B
MSISSDTIVDYPAGATTSRGVVLATLPLPDGLGVVLDRTAFHAVDAGWPDQPADRGALAGQEVIDAVVGATDGGEILIGGDIPVRTGAERWAFVVAHVVAADTPIQVGDEVDVTVDEGYRHALSAGHTACHLASLALDAALASAWTKEVAADTLGAPGFDALACASSRIHEFGSTDVYRVGKSLRKRGFDVSALDDVRAVEDAANARLADWVATGAGIRIDRDGDGLGDRRRWVCELPGGDAVIPCGGTHLTSLGELAAVRVELAREDVEGGVALTMTTTAQA